IRGWHLQLKCDKELRDLSHMFNPVLRGWMRYYSRFHGSAMATVWKHMNVYLARWLMRKYKHLARHKTRARRALGQLAAKMPGAFVHWEAGYAPMAGGWEPDELRGSRPVLRGAGGAIPPVYSPLHPYAERLCLSGCGARLGHSAGTVLATIQQPDYGLLHRSR